jgi:hypothetical protein
MKRTLTELGIEYMDDAELGFCALLRRVEKSNWLLHWESHHCWRILARTDLAVAANNRRHDVLKCPESKAVRM